MQLDPHDKKLMAAGVAFIILFAGLVLFVYSLRSKLPALQTNSKQAETATYPGRVLNLSNWKLTLPVTTTGNTELLQEIQQPTLATYVMKPWFNLNSDSTGVVFRAPVNAETTANSNYPRSELREMTNNGAQEYFWSTTAGIHTLFLDEAITAVPKNKPDVVAGQIHGDNDDLLVIRLEYPKLYITRSKNDVVTLDENYTLGKRFTIKFIAQDGKIMVYYNGNPAPAFTLEKKVQQAYFKVGVYTQSNCSTEVSPDLCSANNFGEVVVYKADVSHQ